MSNGTFVDHNGKQLTININPGSTYVIVDSNGTQIPFDVATAGGAGTFTSLDVSGNGNIDGDLTVGGTITGDLTGNVTGNVSGTAATVTDAAQPAITSVGTLTGLTVAGNVVTSGNARRIQGDFTNATNSNRTLLQSSTADGASSVGVIPNGTSLIAFLNCYNSSDADNATRMQMFANSTQVGLSSSLTGTGTYKEMILLNGGVQALTVAADGLSVLLGRSSAALAAVKWTSSGSGTVAHLTADSSNADVALTLQGKGTGLVNIASQVTLTTGTPASASATGVAGTVVWDADFIYVCTATDTWKRVAIATW